MWNRSRLLTRPDHRDLPLRYDRDVDDLADGFQQQTSIGTEVIGAVEVGKTVDATVLVVTGAT